MDEEQPFPVVSNYIPYDGVVDFLIRSYTDRQIDQLCDVLCTSTTLKTICIWPFLHHVKVKFIMDALKKNHSVTNVDFSCSNTLSDATSLQYLCDALNDNTRITRLRARGNGLGPSGALTLSQCFIAVRSLDLADNKLGNEGAQSVALHLLEGNRMLKQLELSKNGIGAAGVRSLCDALKRNSILTYLDLGCNDLDNECVLFLTEMLSLNSTLRSLRISDWPSPHRRMTAASLTSFSRVMRTNRSLSSLDISCSIADGANGVAHLIQSSPTLYRLYVSGTSLGEPVSDVLKAVRESGSLVDGDFSDSPHFTLCYMRNARAHARALHSTIVLMAIRKYRKSALNTLFLDVVRILAQALLFGTRTDFLSWKESLK